MKTVLRLLSFRGRSRHELLTALRRRGTGDDVCEAVIEEVTRLGYLNDAKFAQDRAVSLLRNGHLAADAVLLRLQAHGLTEEQARQALAAAERELDFDPVAAARALLEKRGLAGRTLTQKEIARAARLLQSRGFSSDIIEALLQLSDT